MKIEKSDKEKEKTTHTQNETENVSIAGKIPCVNSRLVKSFI